MEQSGRGLGDRRRCERPNALIKVFIMTILLGNIGGALMGLSLALETARLRAKCEKHTTDDCTEDDSFVSIKM